MTYFGAIQREHILDAFTEILLGRLHGFGEPVRYYVEHRGHRYPAKAVLGIAREFATGEPTSWDQFAGSAKLEPTFRRLGFTYINADEQADGPDHTILKQIESLGYITAMVKEGGTLALLTEPTVSIDPLKPKEPRRFRQMVRIDGTDDDSRYRAAC